eukprot:TRINITY_DN3954_c0_g3_i1.p1 TRINITY_DN3954_c0_g3~~TRINITY_DN3954_c0_g3_i1.p1  ORF type:complete len:139 (+),score=24.07 TRINITY_DN3954_c0_g3_i1:105-521(+)
MRSTRLRVSRSSRTSLPQFKVKNANPSLFRRIPISSEPLRTQKLYPSPLLSSLFSSSPSNLTKEEEVRVALQEKLSPTNLEIEDVSGGCGTFFSISIASEKFRGKSLVEQHKLVKSALSQILKEMHGITIKTEIPPAT